MVPKEPHDQHAQSVSGDSVNCCLTRVAASNLVVGVRLVSPQPVSNVRYHLAAEGLTTYELIMKLTEDGWSWKASEVEAPTGAPDLPARGRLRVVQWGRPEQIVLAVLAHGGEIACEGFDTYSALGSEPGCFLGPVATRASLQAPRGRWCAEA